MRNIKKENLFSSGFRLVFLLIAAALVYYIWLTSPTVKFPFMLSKLSLVTVAAIVGYYIDLIMFPNFRPTDLAKEIKRNDTGTGETVTSAYALLAGMCNLRRAIIIVGIVIGVGLGV